MPFHFPTIFLFCLPFTSPPLPFLSWFLLLCGAKNEKSKGFFISGYRSLPAAPFLLRPLFNFLNSSRLEQEAIDRFSNTNFTQLRKRMSKYPSYGNGNWNLERQRRETWNRVVQFSVRGEIARRRLYRKMSLKWGGFERGRNHRNETFPIRKVVGTIESW